MRSVVIKAPEDSRAPAIGLAFDLRDLGREADGIIARAHAEAERVLLEARAGAAAELRAAADVKARAAGLGRAEGHRRGMEEGREAGRAAALAEAREQFAAEAAELTASLQTTLDELAARRDRLMAEATRDVLTLSVAVAARVVSSIAGIDKSVAVESAEKALRMIGPASDAVIRVHPSDAERIARFVPELKERIGQRVAVRLVEDSALSAGDVVVQTANGSVDAMLGTQIDRIADELVRDWRGRIQRLTGEPATSASDANATGTTPSNAPTSSGSANAASRGVAPPNERGKTPP